jgi:2-methylcitrate dehydratase PrpD
MSYRQGGSIRRGGCGRQVLGLSEQQFPCGVMIHPALDAALQLRRENHLTADRIDRIELRVHPLVVELTANKTPQTGLETKFSVYHAVAAALVYGKPAEPEFSDEAARGRGVIALRDRVSAIVDKTISEDQVKMTVILKDGERLDKFIAHAVGSAKNPMTDAQLE